MFKIVEKVINSPVRFPAMPGVNFEAGQIAKIVEFDGMFVCDICDGKGVFGVVGSRRKKQNELNLDRNSFVKVWPQRMVFRTDLYDLSSTFEIGSSLYVNPYGLFTTQKYQDNYIAKVITPPGKNNEFFEALWI